MVLAEAVGAEYATAYLGWNCDKLGPENVGTMFNECQFILIGHNLWDSKSFLKCKVSKVLHVDIAAGGRINQPDAQDRASS